MAIPTRTRQLVGVQLLALLGVWRLVMLAYDGHWTRIEYVAFAIVLILIAAAAVAARLALWTFAVFTAIFAVVNLAIAFGSSLVRVAGEDTLAGIWSSGRAIGWVACLLLAWLVAVAHQNSDGLAQWRGARWWWPVRSFLILRPIDGSGYDAIVAASVAAFAGLAACSLVTRNPWRRGLRIGSIPVGLFAATLIGPSLLNAVGSSLTPALDPWGMAATARPDSELVLLEGIGTPWLIGIAAFVLMVAVEVVVTRRPAHPYAGSRDGGDGGRDRHPSLLAADLGDRGDLGHAGARDGRAGDDESLDSRWRWWPAFSGRSPSERLWAPTSPPRCWRSVSRWRWRPWHRGYLGATR